MMLSWARSNANLWNSMKIHELHGKPMEICGNRLRTLKIYESNENLVQNQNTAFQEIAALNHGMSQVWLLVIEKMLMDYVH